MRVIGVLGLLLATVPAPSQQRGFQRETIVARKQVALVIGNSAYANQPLKNPANDARAITARLKELNYDVVPVFDANRRDMNRAIEQFVGRLGTNDVALFFYAGHGVQVDGENYLLPVDFEGQDEIDVRSDALAAGRIQDRMERSGAQLNIVILDACRNNPYRGASRSGTRGLAAMSAGRGTLISFATGPGRTASDGSGRNGLFTEHLLSALSTPGLTLDELFGAVRDRVDRASNGAQTPWTLSSVVGRYSFLPGGISEPASAPIVSEPPPVVSRNPPPDPAPIVSNPPPAVNRGPQPGDVKVNPKDGQRYVWIPPGKFVMGCSPGDTVCYYDEKPPHDVTITKGYWLGQTSVTQASYERVVGKNPSDFKGANLPVDNITWYEAREFCQAIGGRLPTEAEWEYAARGGSTSVRYGDLYDIAWELGNSGGKPHEVGQKRPNGFGLYDMLGNVSQWTADWYGEKYYEQRDGQDPVGPPGGERRTFRGGAWNANSNYVRASRRWGSGPGNRINTNGARCIGE